MDLFSFWWLQVCLNKFSSVQYIGNTFVDALAYADDIVLDSWLLQLTTDVAYNYVRVLQTF